MSPAYLDAVAETDRLLGELLDTVDATPRLSKRLVVVLTADHGGTPGEKDHDDASDVEDYRIPFVVWGRGIRPADLYELNPDYADPGTGRPAYGGPQPVRNGDLANLVTELLGLGPVPGSELDADQDLDWRDDVRGEVATEPTRRATPRTPISGRALPDDLPPGADGGLRARGVDRDDVGELLVHAGDPRRTVGAVPEDVASAVRARDHAAVLLADPRQQPPLDLLGVLHLVVGDRDRLAERLLEALVGVDHGVAVVVGSGRMAQGAVAGRTTGTPTPGHARLRAARTA